MYDDLLMIFPLIALFRLVRARETAGAGALLIAGAAVVLAPSTLYQAAGFPGIA